MCKKKFLNFLPKTRLSQNVSLKTLSTFRIGGLAKWVAYPKSVGELKRVLNYLKKRNVKTHILGCGSNTLFLDGGFDGVIISLKNLNKIKKKKEVVLAYAGAKLNSVISFSKQNSLSGLEWASGIPASVGGAVVSNAGCFGKEMADVIDRVVVLDKGKVKKLNNRDCDFSYRSSKFSKSDLIVLKVYYKLVQENRKIIEENVKNTLKMRKKLQPQGFSAGSVFKKVDGISAGKIIDELGLKGLRIGDAIISKKHANFILNLGSASSDDVIGLMTTIEEKVKNERNITLSREIIIIGENNANNRRFS